VDGPRDERRVALHGERCAEVPCGADTYTLSTSMHAVQFTRKVCKDSIRHGMAWYVHYIDHTS
jgi:hypothetical protein